MSEFYGGMSSRERHEILMEQFQKVFEETTALKTQMNAVLELLAKPRVLVTYSGNTPDPRDTARVILKHEAERRDRDVRATQVIRETTVKGERIRLQPERPAKFKDLYEKAVNIVRAEDCLVTSVSTIQRQLHIGWHTAIKILCLMEEEGYISEADDMGKFTVLITNNPTATD